MGCCAVEDTATQLSFGHVVLKESNDVEFSGVVDLSCCSGHCRHLDNSNFGYRIANFIIIFEPSFDTIDFGRQNVVFALSVQ